MPGEKLSYFNRRAAQEVAAAEAASSSIAADIHRTLAQRFSDLAANEAVMDDLQIEPREG